MCSCCALLPLLLSRVPPLERRLEGDARNWLDEAVLVNPRIVGTGKGKVTDEEGCLSFPGMRGYVRNVPYFTRSSWITV